VEVELGSGALAISMGLKDGERMVVIAHEASEKFNSNTEEWTFKAKVPTE